MSSQLAGRAAVEEELAVDEGLIGHAVPQAGVAVRVVPPQRIQQPSALAVARVGLFQVGVQGHKSAQARAWSGWDGGLAAGAVYGNADARPSHAQIARDRVGTQAACSMARGL